MKKKKIKLKEEIDRLKILLDDMAEKAKETPHTRIVEKVKTVNVPQVIEQIPRWHIKPERFTPGYYWIKTVDGKSRIASVVNADELPSFLDAFGVYAIGEIVSYCGPLIQPQNSR